MDPMEASCFICGSTTIFNRVGPGRKKNFGGLKHLLTRLCEALSVSDEVTPEDWAFLNEAEQQQFICCPECFDLLKNVERVHEILVKTQKQLKYYLDEVQRLIVTSEEKSESLESSLWNLTCFDFRTSVLNRFNDNSEEGGIVSEELRLVKKETEIERINFEDNDEDGYDVGWNADDNFNDDSINFPLDPLEDDEMKPETFEQGQISSKVSITKVESPSTNVNIQLPTCSVTIEKLSGVALPNSKSTPPRLSKKTTTSTFAAKKRKTNLNTLEVTPPPNKSSRRSSPRAAKQSAEAALKQTYANSDTSDKEDDNEDGDPSFQKIDDPEEDEYQENYDNDNDNMSLASESEGNNANEAPVEQPKLKRKRRPRVLKGPVKKLEEYKKSDWSRRKFYALLVADENENLYLYRRQTFVRRTYTHIQCLAYQCTFETPWEFYPSFQIIKQHIEDKHRSRKHIKCSPHPCLLCNILFDTREIFYEHLKTDHPFFMQPLTKAICESCLVHNQSKTLLLHAFKHKNAEEKAAARESKEAPARYLPNKTSRKYTCDECGKSFFDGAGLKRHKQLHLPTELRTDLVLCPECGLQMYKDSLKLHMESMHHPEMVTHVIVCKVCDKKFHPKHRSIYEAHMRYHEGDKPFLCTDCGARFVSSQSLHGHIRHNHRDVGKSYPCEWCDCVYTKYTSWKHHISRKHADKCPEKKYSRKMSKFYADQQPEPVKPEECFGPEQRFPCPECEVICKFNFTLKKHMRRKHGIGEEGVKRPLKNYRRGGEGAPRVEEVNKHTAEQEIDDNSLSMVSSSNEASTSFQAQFGHNFN